MRLRNVYIKWSYPVLWENIKCHELIQEHGLYYITTKINTRWGIKEKSLYIGKTRRSFKERFAEHEKKEHKFIRSKGEIYVRLGIIERPAKLKEMLQDNYDSLLRTIESGLITEINNMQNTNLLNKSQTRYYTLFHELRIHNKGFKGLMVKELNNREHL